VNLSLLEDNKKGREVETILRAGVERNRGKSNVRKG
jgi:hypothetical protein